LVKQQNQIQFLYECIKESIGYEIKAELLYRASKDGWQSSDFHRMCNNKGATISII
jgi:hypothetical protein